MSWMDTWSRQAKHSATPPPFYSTVVGEDVPYCHTCGRVISPRKIQTSKATTPAKYCTDRCKHRKRSNLDKEIEEAFVKLLNGGTINEYKAIPPLAKGDPRLIVMCEMVDAIIFDPKHDDNKTYGRKKNRAARTLDAPSEDEEVAEDDPVKLMTTGTRIRQAQAASLVNGSVGGEKGRAERIQETPEMLAKRREGQKRVDQVELVRNAARRGCAFGFGERKCEGFMKGSAVEASAAKGEWGIRWRP